MTRCPTCYRPEATDEQWKSGACGKNPEGGCECLACCSVCWGACGEKDRIYAWTKDPPSEPGWYWVRRSGHVAPFELVEMACPPGSSIRLVWLGIVVDDHLAHCYEFLPVPLEVPE